MYQVVLHFKSDLESLTCIVRADDSREAVIKAVEVVKNDVELYRIDVKEEPSMVVV